jgi:site-specific recombinase XerC
MTSYAATVRRPPRTLTSVDQARLLKATGQHRDGFRDHVLFSLALGTAMREHELAALDVGDVLRDDGKVRRQFAMRTFKRSTDSPASQDVFLPDSAWYKLTKFIEWKRARGESLDPAAPLFTSRRGTRIATRTLRYLFHTWQQRAGFDRRFNFHALRHTALTNVQRAKRDLDFTQRIARHKDANTTRIYAELSDEDVARDVRDLPC